MPQKRRLKIIKYSCLLLLAIGLCLTHFLIPRLITEIKHPIVGLIKRNRNISFEPGHEKNLDFSRKAVKIRSFDGLQLSALISFTNLEPAKGTVILLHGIRSNKNQFQEASLFLAANGYNTVALDSRAHGESEGQFCSFGVHEKVDIQKLIDYLNTEEQLLEHIGVWGQSLGGAIGLQAMGIDKRIEFGIIESAFSDFKTIVNDYSDFHLGFNIPIFSNYLVDRAGSISEFDPDDAKPSKYCKSINQPILIVHGNADKRINIKYAKENFSKIKSKEKTLIEIDSANHSNVWNRGGTDYFNTVLTFMDLQTTSSLR